MQDIIGQSIKGYELKGRLGEGAYGAVYRATQPQVKREVAIKIILPEYANRPDFIRRFEAEAQLVAQLEHLHIVPLYDHWREPDGAYLVMRLMKGGSLADSLRESGPWEPADAARLVDQIASALDAAHTQGVVHRDMKPANILLDEDSNAYLSDFGIAKEMGADAGVTQTGAIVGTPAYITPEQVQSLPVTPQTDIYSLGVMLYELLVGWHPFPDTPTGELVVKHLSEPLPYVREVHPGLPAAVDGVIQRATSKDPETRYPDVLSFAVDLRRALDMEVDVLEIPADFTNPYKGLRAFQEVDADDFFGREALTGQLLARLVETPNEGDGRFLAVVGPSGSGKSSVVKAGLVPALRVGALPGSDQWFITEMVPGAHPVEELERALMGIATNPNLNLAQELSQDTFGLLRATWMALPSKASELLLVIDQFEELFVLVEDESERAHFLEILHTAVTNKDSHVRVIITLRADFYDRPLMYPAFSALMQTRTEVVVPLTPDELEQAVEAPASRVGAVMEQGLVPAIIADVAEQPGALPLLQYALTELFERREGRMLTNDAYQSIGGVLGALGRRAEEIFNDLDQELKQAARQLFLRLVTLGEGVEDTRRRVMRVELEGLIRDRGQGVEDRELGKGGRGQYSVINGVLDAFGEARLLSFDRDPVTRGPTVEVAHEALIQEWRRLQEWLDESRADIRMQRVLGNSAHEWLEVGRDAGFLLRGSRLDQFEAWVEGTDLALTADEQTFLDASLEERHTREDAEAERQARELATERRSRNFLRGLVVVLAVAAIVAVVLSAVAFKQQGIAQDNAATATIAQGQALFKAATAVVAQEEAKFQSEQAASAAVEAQAAAVEEAEARLDAERASRLATSRELVAFTLNELEQPTDPSFSLALLLAGESVLSTWQTDGYVLGEAEVILRQAINAAPILLTTLSGHTEAVHFATWSPDGDQIATTSLDETVRIWNAVSGTVVRVLQGHTAVVNTAFWSPDGTRIITASNDGTVRVWNAHSGEELYQLPGHPGVVHFAAWSPDGTRIVTTDDQTTRIWDSQTSEQILQIQGHTGNIRFASWNPDMTRIATASDDGTIKIWDALTGEEQHSLEAQASAVHSVQWSMDGRRLVSAHWRDVARIWDTQSWEVIHDLRHPTSVQFAAWSPDGDQIATANSDGTIYIWDSQTGEVKRRMQAHETMLWSVNWSPEGTRIVTADDDSLARIWETRTLEEIRQLEHTYPVYSAEWSPDGSHIVTAGGLDRTAHVWDAQTSEELQLLEGHYSPVQAASWSPNGESLATASLDGTARIWDALTGDEMFILLGHTGGVNQAAWSLLGDRLATAGQDRTARIWDAENGEEIRVLKGHTGAVTSAKWCPENEHIITTSDDLTARVWDAETGEELQQLLGHTERVNAAAWSPDGASILTASSDRTVRVWDAQSGEQLRLLEGHREAVWSAAWSPDGEQIASASSDGSVRIWDANTGEQIGEIGGHDDVIWSVDWSPDGTHVTTASSDHTARIWPIGVQGLLQLAEVLIQRMPPVFSPEERCSYLHECNSD